jgi:protein-serine/threonine kinase
MAAVASQPPHGQQQYYQQQSPAAASPASARRPARRPSNGASPNTPTTPQTHHSPAVSNNSTLTTPRAHPLPPSTQNSPAMNNTATSSGPMPPPRTSSHRTPGSSDASQSRRREKESPRQTGSSSRSQPQHSRSASAVGQPPTGTSLPREESTVINRIVVADPQEDIARAEARQAESRSGASGADLTPITGLGLVGSEGVDDGGRGGGRSRQDHSKSETAKRSKFGNYILGQTLGEGEFGKVKMGWKRDSTVEVAIKLIRRETLGSNSNRLQKIYREIQILRQLDHPNIVRLHEMVETDRHIGIILEYASGGELFDYILNHRYLKDGPARKLFSQLISGVGYLHRKGIVHRDLKLENLLLDRNKNIIITDFGFANTFDPNDELGEEVEYRLGDKDFIKSLGLDGSDASRRGDLMQTSCGSPCYAAPELVVSDSLYTGRKVDVWSCGVILVRLLILLLAAKSNFYSTPCWLVTYHSTTIQRIPRVITSIYFTNISYRHLLHSPNTSRHTQETFLSGYSFPTQENARICSRLRVTAGWPTIRTWLDSSHPATPTRRRPSRLLSIQVSALRVSI